MVQDVRSSGVGVAFDLLSQAGVMRALQYVRASLASSEEKREVRDLIFSYTNTGGDPALRTLIEQRLAVLPAPATPSTQAVEEVAPISSATVQISPAVVVTPAVPAPLPRYGFASGRPAPQFAPVSAVTVPVRTLPVFSADSLPVIAPAPVVAPVVEMPITAEVASVVIPTRAPAVTESETAVPVIEAVVPVEVVAAPAAPVAALSSPDVALDRQRARISEIKQDVNGRVGNPVNLITMNREVGSAYMTSLLAAMKLVSGGTGDIAAGMRDLEASYQKVVELFTPTSVVPTIPTIVAAAEPAVVASGYQLAATTQDSGEVVAPVISPLSISRREPGGVPAQTSSRPRPIMPVAAAETDTAEAIQIQSTRLSGIPTVASVPPLKTPRDLPTAAEKKAELGITDPLLDPDVDAGLDQLLSEWAIFKKSGMFGTGPRGRMHPAFIKLGAVNMLLIVAGRFEGATSEIRQSITDYMNGWRYEQGITYENDETFEHYLRRVVRHILDLQSNRRRS